MFFNSTNGSSSLGPLNSQPFLTAPPLASFIAEWASIFPLVCHLSNYRQNHQLLGQVALLGRISVGIFPHLGVLAGISKLLENGEGFAESASTRGSSSQRVWDVAWGSTFLSANGAASSLIMQWALKRTQTEVNVGMGSVTVKRVALHDNESARAFQRQAAVEIVPLLTTDHSFQRQQTLHMLYFTRSRSKASWYSTVDNFMNSWAYRVLSLIFQLGVTVSFALIGAYGSAATLFCGTTAQLALYFLEVLPFQGFLKNNEVHDACMLVAPHENASVWYLCTGDRGIVDSLLNKAMVVVPSNKRASIWFKLAHFIQLLSMTFVAAQKGWDGICLLVLLLFSFEWPIHDLSLAAHFCRVNDVDIKAKTFKFSGRSPMLGAIQSMSGSQTTIWMDGILVPSARRDLWLQAIMKNASETEKKDQRKRLESLSSFDQDWILKNEYMTREAAEVLNRALREFKGCSAQL